MPRIMYSTEHNINLNDGTVNRFPDVCPFCNKGMVPIYISSFKSDTLLQAVFRCPLNNCKCLFIGYYTDIGANRFNYFDNSKDTSLNEYVFDDVIKTLSPDFCNIYNQAFKAEQMGLSEICGIGYRKAFEFLIKDYLCSKSPGNRETILKKPLGQCIDQDIDHPKVKSMAKRAVWLGNDETHYIRKHQDMDVNDLKTLIEITQHWILFEMLSNEYEERLT